jgi:hypothetical protein
MKRVNKQLSDVLLRAGSSANRSDIPFVESTGFPFTISHFSFPISELPRTRKTGSQKMGELTGTRL